MNDIRTPSIEVFLQQEIQATPEQLLVVLLDHLKLGRFFRAKFVLINGQDSNEISGGKGSIRQVSIGKHQFLEEIIAASKRGISYRIVGAGPVFDHRGDIMFTSTSTKPNVSTKGQSKLVQYRIKCNGPKWTPDFIVKYVISRDIKQALKQLAIFFNDQHH